MSTTDATPAAEPLAPGTLYSVITEYGPSQITAEHFPNQHARTESLIERVQQFTPVAVAVSDLRCSSDDTLAALLASLLSPATIHLTESVLNPRHGTYHPVPATHLVT